MIDNNIFSQYNASNFNFGDMLSKMANAGKTADAADEYDWKSAYLTLKDDFTSYRKRVENARQQEKRNLTKEIIGGFLDLVDYAIFTYKAKNLEGTYTKEDEMILNKLSTFLKAYDIHPMKDPVGHPFDRNLQEAVCSMPSGIYESGIVTNVVSYGYMMGNEVLRYAKVGVAV